jgi:hypothetical protein
MNYQKTLALLIFFLFLCKKGAKTHYEEIPREFLVPKFAWRIFGTLVARYSAFL